MSRPSFDVAAFLAEPGRPAGVATVTRRGNPALATMWFVFADGRLWFHTPTRAPNPFLAAIEQGREIAAMISSFDPPQDVRQVRATGPGRLEPNRPERTRAVYNRYVTDWDTAWERQVASPDYRLWSLFPQRGMAVAYPGLKGGAEYRWTHESELVEQTAKPAPRA